MYYFRFFLLFNSEEVVDEILKGGLLASKTKHKSGAKITQRSCKKSLLFPPMTLSLAPDYRRLKQMKSVSSQSVELNSVCLSLVCSFACVF